MKKLAKILVLLVLLAALLAGYLIFSSYMEKKEAENNVEEEDTAVDVLSIDKNVISSIEYVYDEETVSLKKEDGKWQWTEDAEFPVDQTYPEDMAAALSTIIADRLIADDLENEADFGMDEPNFTVKYTTTGGAEYVYTIGDYNSAAKGYYIKSSVHEKIYMTKESAVDPFVYYMLDMIEPDTLDKPKAEKIKTAEFVLEGKKYVLTTDKTGADFYTDPYIYFFVGDDGVKKAADGLAAGELMSAVAGASLGNVEGFKTDAETLEKYGLGENKLLVLKVTYDEDVETEGSDASVNLTKEKSYSLNIGKFVDGEATKYYVMIDGSNILYKLDGGNDLFEALEADFISKLICPVSADDTVSFKVEIGEEYYFYNIADIENNEKLTGIFNSITSLVTNGTAENEKGELVAKVTFNMDGSEQVLEICKYDEENYVAVFDKRDDMLVSKEKVDGIIKELQS